MPTKAELSAADQARARIVDRVLKKKDDGSFDASEYMPKDFKRDARKVRLIIRGLHKTMDALAFYQAIPLHDREEAPLERIAQALKKLDELANAL